MSTAVQTAWRLLQHRFENRGTTFGLPTGFSDIDDLTGGLQRGELTVLAGRPSMGCTALALNMVQHVALNAGRAVVLFSLDRSTAEITLDLTSLTGRISREQLLSGEIPEDTWPQVSSAMTLLSAAPIFIVDKTSLAHAQLATIARRLKREHDVQLIVIDRLDLLCGAGNAETGIEIVRTLNELAKELAIPILLLARVRRAVEMRHDKRPSRYDLGESSPITRFAETVMFLYRDEVYDVESPDPGIAEIMVERRHDRSTAAVKLRFLSGFGRFESIVPSEHFAMPLIQ